MAETGRRTGWAARRGRTPALVAAALLFAPVAGPGAEDRPPADEAVIEEILALEASLSAEGREELARRRTAPLRVPAPALETEGPEPAGPRVEEPEEVPGGCSLTAWLDQDADGHVGPLDRYWRLLVVWSDRNGDGRVDQGETTHPHELGIVALDDREYRDREGAGGRVRTGTWGVELEGLGILLIDATRLARGDGPRLVARDGGPVEGLTPLTPDLSLRGAGGSAPLGCL